MKHGLGGVPVRRGALRVELASGSCSPGANTGRVGLTQMLPQVQAHLLGHSGPRSSSAISPGHVFACEQVPGNFLCLMEN